MKAMSLHRFDYEYKGFKKPHKFQGLPQGLKITSEGVRSEQELLLSALKTRALMVSL